MTAIGDRVFTGSTDNFLYALSTRDGGVAWRWRTGGDVVGHAVADAKRVYFTSLDAMVRAVDRHHGDLRWQRPLTTRPAGDPVLAGTEVIVAGVAPELRAFRVSDGGVTATAPVPGRPMHGPFLAPESASAPPRLIVLIAGGHLNALGQTVEPMLSCPRHDVGKNPPEMSDRPFPVRPGRKWHFATSAFLAVDREIGAKRAEAEELEHEAAEPTPAAAAARRQACYGTNAIRPRLVVARPTRWWR
jgi:hypothetical protein